MKKSEVQNIKALVVRVRALMESYLAALENSIHNVSYNFQKREEDARVFNTLAQTLIRLAELDNLIQPLDGEKDDETIQEDIEQRLLKVLATNGDKNLPQ